jgi:NADPH:quinone reductase-like Zn-dependent oxidoreductase
MTSDLSAAMNETSIKSYGRLVGGPVSISAFWVSRRLIRGKLHGEAHIDVTDLIWKRARMKGFALVVQPPAVKREAWDRVMALIASGTVVPIIARAFPLEQAAEALRYLHEDRPFGKVVLAL